MAASVFGAIFAPRPELVAAEMFRAVRPGGSVAMVNYGGGYFQRLSDLLGRLSTSTAELPSPFLWGDEDEVRRRLDPYAATIDIECGTLPIRFDSFEDWRTRFAGNNPPLRAMKTMLPPPAYEQLEAEAWALAEESGESDYVVVLATNLRG